MANEKETLINNMIDKVIITAISEVGYKEGTNNKNKFAAELDSVFYYNPQKKQNVSWCSIFVTWCFYKVFGLDLCRKMLYQPVKDNYSASCTYQYNYYKKHNKIMADPQKGYQIFFCDSKDKTKIVHTGLIYKVDKTKIYTVEGNKSNQVKKCSYNKSSTKIYPGFGKPDYEADLEIVDTKPTPEPVKPSPVVSRYKIVHVNTRLRIRYEASTNSPVVGYLYNGNTVMGEDIGDWIKLTEHKYIFKEYTEKIYSDVY